MNKVEYETTIKGTRFTVYDDEGLDFMTSIWFANEDAAKVFAAESVKMDSEYIKTFAEMLLEAINDDDLDIDEVKATLEEWANPQKEVKQ